MNFQDQIQQIFGTTDIHELKQISRDADNYRCLYGVMNNSIEACVIVGMSGYVIQFIYICCCKNMVYVLL